MKTISIRELHNRTGALVREASRRGEIRATDNGRMVAKIVAQIEASTIPYFARRKPSRAFKRLDASGKTGRGTDSTISISQDREDVPVRNVPPLAANGGAFVHELEMLQAARFLSPPDSF